MVALRQEPSVTIEAGIWLGRAALPLGEADSDPGRADDLQWQVHAGETVAAVIRRWAQQAGYTPLPHFSAAESWTFIVDQQFVGNFEQALIWLSDGFQRQPLRPVAVLFANHTLDLVAEPSFAAQRGDRRLEAGAMAPESGEGPP